MRSVSGGRPPTRLEDGDPPAGQHHEDGDALRERRQAGDVFLGRRPAGDALRKRWPAATASRGRPPAGRPAPRGRRRAPYGTVVAELD